MSTSYMMKLHYVVALFLMISMTYCNGLLQNMFKTGLGKGSSMSSYIMSDDMKDLFNAVNRIQSKKSEIAVENIVTRIADKAKTNVNLRQKVKAGAAYRTVWSSVTASSPIGEILKQRPCSVLGGDSWQIVSEDTSKVENLVYWPIGPDISLRMAGLADIFPISSINGYELIIRGLEFRISTKERVPEVYSTKDSKSTDDSDGSYTFRLFYLDNDAVELINGRGTLEILYNDGIVRVSRDNIQKNTYIHVLEPLDKQFAKMFPINP